MYFGLSAGEWQVIGVLGGLLVGVVGLVINAVFGWRRDQREARQMRGTQ